MHCEIHNTLWDAILLLRIVYLTLTQAVSNNLLVGIGTPKKNH